MKKILFTMCLLILSSTIFAKTLQSLDQTQVTNAISDKTISMPIVTLNGQMIENRFTAYINKNNTIKGQFANKPDSDVQTDQGTWQVKPDGTVCVTWQHWNATQPICVVLYKLTNGYVFVNADNNRLETILLTDDIRSGDQLS